MKKNLLLFIVSLFGAATCGAQVYVTTKVEGKFSVSSWSKFGQPGQVDLTGVSNPDFPNGLMGEFSYTLAVPQSGAFSVEGVNPDSVSLSPATFGHTLFNRENLGLELWFSDGAIYGAILGGFTEGVSGWREYVNPPPGTISDLSMLVTPQGGSILFYNFDGFVNDYYGIQFSGSLVQTPLPVTPVPEPSTYGIFAGLVAATLIGFRCREPIRRVGPKGVMSRIATNR